MDTSLSDLLLCIVVYEKKVVDCETFISLDKALINEKILLDVVVYDNSKIPDTQIIFYKKSYPRLNIHYIHNENNPGLGIAYNEAAEFGVGLKKKFICLFDQDSDIPINYFDTFLNSTNKSPSLNLFVPTVTSNKIIISPSSFYLGRSWVKNKKEVGLLNTRNHSIINSGSIIRLAEFNRLGGYEPSLPLDFSDHYFFYRYKRQNPHFFVMPVYLEHQLSTFFDKDYLKVFNRFKIYCDAATFFALNTKNTIALFWAFLHSVKLSFIYRRITFIKYAISIFKK